jgi:hypothetical protein
MNGRARPEAVFRFYASNPKPTRVMIFPKTQDSLSSHSRLWQDGYLVFGCGLVDPPGRNMEAALKFFGQQDVMTSISGFPQELLITERTLHRVDLDCAHDMLASLLEVELRMFSTCSFEMKYVDDLTKLFLQEAGDCEVYTNVSMTSTGMGTSRFSSWSPVTRHARDIFLCAVNDRHLGYWLYTDDD